MQLKGAFFI